MSTTVPELARRYRVGEDKIRRWIDAGELAAINVATTTSGRPRYLISEEAIADFERRRSSIIHHTPTTSRRRREKPRKEYV